MRTTPTLLLFMIVVAALFTGCDSTPSGIINQDDMAHVLADFAKADMLIEENPDMFPSDSSKLMLKQSILSKYDADMAMYDSSLVWYAHNLKVFSKVHDKAIEILEKESNNGAPVHTATRDGNFAINGQNNRVRRTFPNSGDSANVWKEPQQWMLTNAVRSGYIKFDYPAGNDSRKGDKYALCFKMINTGNAVTMLVAIDYHDGCTSYINRTAQANGWIENAIQGDTSKVIKRIYGFIKYKTRPLGITFIDSTYLLRTHLDPGSYSTISQRIVGPKAIIEKQSQEAAQQAATPPPASTNPREVVPPPQGAPPQPGNNTYPGRRAGATPSRPVVPYPGRPATPLPGATYKPKPGLNKSSTPRGDMRPNPNGAHLSRPAER